MKPPELSEFEREGVRSTGSSTGSCKKWKVAPMMGLEC